MKPVPSFPRIVWVGIGGLVALVALYMVTLPPSGATQRVAVRPVTPRLSRLSPTVKTAELVSNSLIPGEKEISASGRSLTAYARLQHRNLFHALIRRPSDQLLAEGSVSGGAGMGLLPATPLGGLPLEGIDGSAIPQTSLGSWIYVGYSTVDGLPNAFLENKGDHQGRTAQIGDRIEGATVVAVSQTGIRVMKAGKAVLLLRTDPSAPVKVAKAKDAKAGNGIALPGASGPGAPPAGNPQPNGMPGGPPQNMPQPSPGGPPPGAMPMPAPNNAMPPGIMIEKRG